MNQKRITPDERETLCCLEALSRVFSAYGDRLKHLCERAHGADRIDEMAKAVDILLAWVADTIPADQLFKIVQQMRMTDVHVGLKKPTGKPKDYWVTSYDDLADLAEYATKTECFTCDGAKHNCRLRQILKDLPIQGVSNLVVGCWKDE